MAVYCHEVRQLEDKFDGLELSHVQRRLNEVAGTLAKIASSREPVPTGVFASDLHKPSVRYEVPEQAGNEPPIPGSGANQPLVSSNPEATGVKPLALGLGAD